jgi:hypothetical protein
MEMGARGSTARTSAGPAPRAVIALLLLLAVPALPTSDADDDGSDTSREQCLKIVDPVPGYVLTLDDHQSMPVLLRVNCPVCTHAYTHIIYI